MTARRISGFMILLGIVLAALAVRLFFGPVLDGEGGWSSEFGWPDSDRLPLRLGAAFSAIAAGWALGLAGLGPAWVPFPFSGP